MARHTLAELTQQVEKRNHLSRTKQNQRYHLARALGFSGDESAVLQNWSEEAIRELAEQRGK
jgi:hypothetical protein